MNACVPALVEEPGRRRGGGYNKAHGAAAARAEPHMSTVNARVLATIVRDDAFEGVHNSTAIPGSVRNEMRRAEASSSASMVLVKDKKDRATVEQVLRTPQCHSRVFSCATS